MVLVCGVFLISASVANVIARTHFARSKVLIIAIAVFGLAIVSWSRQPIRYAKRLLQPTVRRQIDADPRAPLLFLRSFQDDALEVRPPFALAGAIDTFSGKALVRFEEVVAWSAWERGPLRAIGEPGTRLQPLGAVRDYFDNASWQDAVTEIAEEVQAIVLIAGRSRSLVWEIGHVRAMGMLAKTVFVFAPVTADEAARRIAVVCTALELDPCLLQAGDFRHVLVLGFDADGNPQVHVAAGRTADAYVVALNQALDCISPAAHVSKPADWSFLESQAPQTGLAKFDKSKVKSSRSIISWISDILGSFVSV
jgi:hypothetical protein